MSYDQDRQEEQINERVLPTTRGAFLDEWRENPQKVLDRADDAELTLQGYADARSPASEDSPGSAIEFILHNEGIRMNGGLSLPSSRIKELPDLDPQKGSELHPMARAAIAYWDEIYTNALVTGVRAATASTSNLTPDGGWRPFYNARKTPSPLIAPGFNFMEVVAYTDGINEDKYRVRRLTNATTEQMMKQVAEGTAPKLFELSRAKEDVQLKNYRAGIEWTDSFARDPQTRLSDITRAIEEVAIGHRIELLVDLGKTVKDNVKATYITKGKVIAGQTIDGGVLVYPSWNVFLKQFGDAYTANVALGTGVAITALELMSMTADENITYGSWKLLRGSGVRSLNGDGEDVDHGYINGSGTGFVDTSLYAFQRETTLVFVMRLGMDQDEMERSAGSRKWRRYLGAMSAFAVADPEIREIDFKP